MILLSESFGNLFSNKFSSLDELPFVPYNDIVIVEGSYSHHPYFENNYDIKIFLEIAPEEQKKRIVARDGEAIWPMFETKWIPMEHRYFETFKIKSNRNLVI